MSDSWEGLMPRDNPRDTRFAINFFTSIGLGALTEDLRAHLKNAPKPTAIVAPMVRGTYSASQQFVIKFNDNGLGYFGVQGTGQSIGNRIFI